MPYSPSVITIATPAPPLRAVHRQGEAGGTPSGLEVSRVCGAGDGDRTHDSDFGRESIGAELDPDHSESAESSEAPLPLLIIREPIATTMMAEKE